MKPFREQNYYELLEILPDASPLEIRRAYKRVFELYQDESIVSYSFFFKGGKGRDSFPLGKGVSGPD
jgi:hypothetical protein